jgi:leader peptidase (prepilin peptidase)/N-methyltransferase
MALLLAILGVTLALSVFTDLRDRTIRNAVTFPAFVLALLARGFDGWAGEAGLASGLAGAALAFACFFLVAWRGGLGMGDVTLAAVVGSCLGFAHTPLALVAIGLAGGVQALLALAWQGALRAFLAGGARGITVPYGLSIAAGSAFAVIWQRAWGVG